MRSSLAFLAALLIAASSNTSAQWYKPPKVDLPRPPKVDLPRPPKVDLPKLPKIDLPKPPKIDLPPVRPPQIQMPPVRPPQIQMPPVRPPQIQMPPLDPSGRIQQGLDYGQDRIDAATNYGRDQFGRVISPLTNAWERAQDYQNERLFFAYRDYWVGRNGIRTNGVRILPGSLHYNLIQPILGRMLNLSDVVLYFESVVPPQMWGITFGNAVYIHDTYRPDDLNQAIAIAHEMMHTVQYSRLGGQKEFGRRYMAQLGTSLLGAIASGNYNVDILHDQVELEREANAVEAAVAQVVANYQPTGFGAPGGLPAPPVGMPPQPPPGPAPAQELFAGNLGMVYTPVRYSDGTFGARVTRPPDAGTPAAALGLEPGDVIVMLDGQRFRTPDDVLAHRYQTTVTLVNVRTNGLQTMNVLLP